MSLIIPHSGTKKETGSCPIENFHKVANGLYRSAQPTRAGFHYLKEQGFKTVMNLRMMHDTDPEEFTTVHLLGMKWHHVPLVPVGIPSPACMEHILKTIAEADKPMLIHCQHGQDRTGLVIACFRIRYLKWQNKDALDEAEKLGMGNFETAMKTLILTFDKPKT